MFERIAGLVALQWGWRRYCLALAAGALAAFAQAPYHAFPVLWVSLPVLVWLLDGAIDGGGKARLGGLGPAFRIGWAFGFGYFLNGLWWIGEAFLVDADQYAWAMPFAVTLFPLGLGLFHGLAAALARAFWMRGPARILVLTLAWTAIEYGRGHVLTGFPWNDLGYGLAANPVLMQAASLVGLHGLTVPAVLIFAAPAALDGRGRGRVFVASAALLLVGLAGFGAYRLAAIQPGSVAGVRLRLMQPAVTEWTKWRPDQRADLLGRYIEQSRTNPEGQRDSLSGITHLIWPESPFSFILAREPWALASIADMVREASSVLITGAIRLEAPAPGDERPRFYNSIFVIGTDGQIQSAYDKAHLVPFGEYMPAEAWLRGIGLQQLTQIKSAFSVGPGPRTLAIPGAPPAGMTICYEAVFPGAIVDPRDRPSWLVNLTNDAWFGLSPGPYQHLHQARLRAVEEGLPMIRVANSGISAVIDSSGNVIASLPLGKVGNLDSNLPNALQATLYGQYRDLGLVLEFLLLALLAIAAKFRSDRISG